MANLRSNSWFSGLLRQKPSAQQSGGLKAYSEHVKKTGASEPTEKLLKVYMAYKRTQRDYAA